MSFCSVSRMMVLVTEVMTTLTHLVSTTVPLHSSDSTFVVLCSFPVRSVPLFIDLYVTQNPAFQDHPSLC